MYAFVSLAMICGLVSLSPGRLGEVVLEVHSAEAIKNFYEEVSAFMAPMLVWVCYILA